MLGETRPTQIGRSTWASFHKVVGHSSGFIGKGRNISLYFSTFINKAILYPIIEDMTDVQLAMIVLPLMKLSKTERSLTHPQVAARIWVTIFLLPRQ